MDTAKVALLRKLAKDVVVPRWPNIPLAEQELTDIGEATICCDSHYMYDWAPLTLEMAWLVIDSGDEGIEEMMDAASENSIADDTVRTICVRSVDLVGEALQHTQPDPDTVKRYREFCDRLRESILQGMVRWGWKREAAERVAGSWGW